MPPPIQQSIRYDSAGRRRYLDVDFGTFAVEVDGGVHLRAQNYWADARRQNDLVMGGDRILRFSSYAIRVDEDVVIAQLRRAHQVFGEVSSPRRFLERPRLDKLGGSKLLAAVSVPGG